MFIETLVAGFQAGLGAMVLRNITGYLKKMLEDGKITKYELKMLCITAITNIAYATAFILVGLPIEQAAGLAFLSDVGVGALKDAGVKKE